MIYVHAPFIPILFTIYETTTQLTLLLNQFVLICQVSVNSNSEEEVLNRVNYFFNGKALSRFNSAFAAAKSLFLAFSSASSALV